MRQIHRLIPTVNQTLWIGCLFNSRYYWCVATLYHFQLFVDLEEAKQSVRILLLLPGNSSPFKQVYPNALTPQSLTYYSCFDHFISCCQIFGQIQNGSYYYLVDHIYSLANFSDILFTLYLFQQFVQSTYLFFLFLCVINKDISGPGLVINLSGHKLRIYINTYDLQMVFISPKLVTRKQTIKQTKNLIKSLIFF